jgi:hypothetical protein
VSWFFVAQANQKKQNWALGCRSKRGGFKLQTSYQIGQSQDLYPKLPVFSIYNYLCSANSLHTLSQTQLEYFEYVVGPASRLTSGNFITTSSLILKELKLETPDHST